MSAAARKLPYRPTLAHVFVFTVAGLVLFLGALYWILVDSSRASIVESSNRFREQASLTLSEKVDSFLQVAEHAVLDTEVLLKREVLKPGDWTELERFFYARMLESPDLEELTLTYARKEGFEADGRMRLAPEGRGQFSVCRTPSATGERFLTRKVQQKEGGFGVELREDSGACGFLENPLKSGGAETIADPTGHDTFQTLTHRENLGRLNWSDLHPAERESAPRFVVTVMKAVEDAQGRFLGVLRAGLFMDQLRRVTKLKLDPRNPNDPHHILLCDPKGQLITAGDPDERLVELAEEFRVDGARLPDPLKRALALSELQAMSATDRIGDARFEDASGIPYLASFRRTGVGPDWVIGIVVPEEAYLGGLPEIRRRMLVASLLVMLTVLSVGVFTVRLVKGDLGGVLADTAKMQEMDFAPSQRHAFLRDVQGLRESLEQAKTAVRAMGKYVPLALVRQLYRERSEPQLGGELRTLSVMFTDIENFTTLSEQLTPNQLAEALGDYLKVMTEAVHTRNGTIDKFIGDAVMAFWNAPNPVADHPRQACQAALDCVKACRVLFASSAWKGRPAFRTRFGLHLDSVMVGHLGSPERMNYTVIGDGVNLASRLEGLNKQYESTILVSEAVYEQVKGAFPFRLIDRVAVKGRTQGVNVYELLADPGPTAGAIEGYEKAYQAYLRRDFAGARAMLQANPEDGPSRALAERCVHYLQEPPPSDWDGVYTAKSK